MGMFDSVFVRCPNCQNEIEFQSKAGLCQLKRYFYTNVPATIAEDLNGESKICSECETYVELTAIVPRISMDIISRHEKNEWD